MEIQVWKPILMTRLSRWQKKCQIFSKSWDYILCCLQFLVTVWWVKNIYNVFFVIYIFFLFINQSTNWMIWMHLTMSSRALQWRLWSFGRDFNAKILFDPFNCATKDLEEVRHQSSVIFTEFFLWIPTSAATIREIDDFFWLIMPHSEKFWLWL